MIFYRECWHIKLLTLNTHSLVEENYIEKLMEFVEAIGRELPDIIALQEVNQTCSTDVVPNKKAIGYFPCRENITLKKDNHVWQIVKLLREKGVNYYWTWLPLKKGYDQYDEGIALMSLSPIKKTDVLPVSDVDDYKNWKTRKILGISIEGFPNEWFYSVHYGWWGDEEEPFEKQWKKTDAYLSKENRIWLLGDFNNPAQIRNQGYDRIKSSGWQDTYLLAKKKDDGITVGTIIDGWKDKIKNTSGMRIDQIWCNQRVKIKSSEVIFNGVRYEIVSDHYGVIVEMERRKENENI